MTATLGNKIRPAGRNLILISGYYGFQNLGDEAILETLIDELKKLGLNEHVVVLSNSPAETEHTFNVAAIDRWKFGPLMKLLPHTKLLISGGGGLFQDSVSMRSPLFYGSQIALATLLGSDVMVFAQGVGPLEGGLSRTVTKGAFSLAQSITVRDAESQALLNEWQIQSDLTADPVWALQSKPLPEKLEQWRKDKSKKAMRVALSLRMSPNMTADSLVALVECMLRNVPPDAVLVPLSLQPNQDESILKLFIKEWTGQGRKVDQVDTSIIERPSQWISLLSSMDLVVAMRLHCSIMALISGVPTVPIAYDPKVAHVARQFELPSLNLTKEGNPDGGVHQWNAVMKSAIDNRRAMSKKSAEKAQSARNMACQNFELLAKILGKQSTT